MLEKLKGIDTKAVKALVKLNQEKSQIRGFLEKADKLREKADSAVYDRVKGDYETRHAELDMKAVPLKDEARTEYQKLASLRNQIEALFESARVDKEELEFRHAVGELPDKDLQVKLKDAEKVLSEREAELAEAEKLKKQFVEAFDSEAELEDDGGAFEDEDEDQGDGDPFEDEDEEGDGDESETRTGYEVNGADGDLDQTGIVSFGPADDSQPAGVETFILPVARLISIDEEGGEGEQYPLGAFNYIGRTDENQIRITLAGVSRKHALVKATPAGFAIEDLKSHNGTFVNDERVDERHLEDGDLIAIGNVRLLFRVAEPA